MYFLYIQKEKVLYIKKVRSGRENHSQRARKMISAAAAFIFGKHRKPTRTIFTPAEVRPRTLPEPSLHPSTYAQSRDFLVAVAVKNKTFWGMALKQVLTLVFPRQKKKAEIFR